MSEDACGCPSTTRHGGLGWQPLQSHSWLYPHKVAKKGAPAMLLVCNSTQKSRGYPLALPLHNPNRMQWTQEAKILPLPQQYAVLPARALCQATNCAVLNPSYFYSISCNCQRYIRCLTSIMAVWCCLFESCTTRAEVNEFFAPHFNENFCHTTSANLHTNTLVIFKIKPKRLSGTACAFILDTIGT